LQIEWNIAMARRPAAIDPIVRPRGPRWLASGGSDGRIAREKLSSQLGWAKKPEQLESAMQRHTSPIPPGKSVTLFGETPRVGDFLSERTWSAGMF